MVLVFLCSELASGIVQANNATVLKAILLLCIAEGFFWVFSTSALI